MNLADNIKAIMDQKGLKQIDGASHIGVDKSAYSKIENGTRVITVDELYRTAELFNITTNPILAYDWDITSEVAFEGKTAVEQLRLINQLKGEDRQTIFRLISKMLTNKKFKDFFQKNVAAL